MSGQCCQNQPKFDGVSAGFKRALWIVIVINGVMFVVEMIAGRISQSQALQADALDFFADTITYLISANVQPSEARAQVVA
jgi:Co/Zn/Cd efflux system component